MYNWDYHNPDLSRDYLVEMSKGDSYHDGIYGPDRKSHRFRARKIAEARPDIPKFFVEHDGDLSDLVVDNIGPETKTVLKKILKREWKRWLKSKKK